jgi:hypothetical protein
VIIVLLSLKAFDSWGQCPQTPWVRFAEVWAWEIDRLMDVLSGQSIIHEIDGVYFS